MTDAKTKRPSLPMRDQLPRELCWDLTPLYADSEAWESDFRKLDSLLEKVQSFRGRLGDAPVVLRDALDAGNELDFIEEKLSVYAHLKFDEDTGNSQNAGRYDRICGKCARIEGETAWFEPELLAIPEARFSDFLEAEELQVFRRTLQESARMRNRVLSPSEERILGMSSEIMGNAQKVFGLLNDADLKFEDVADSDGTTHPLTHGSYVPLLDSPDRTLRENAFLEMYRVYENHVNTFAALLDGEIKCHVLNKELRGYDSSLHAALDSNNIPTRVYDSLIASVRARLPGLHRYFSLRANVMKLDTLDMYDILNPLVPSADVRYTWEEAVPLVRNAVAVLGEEYLRAADLAFLHRWIDVSECKGKRSGAYSSGAYRTPPYILLNYSGTLDSVYTLAHELGHTMHSYFSDQACSYQDAGYRIFAAEVASTVNELLLHHDLLKKAPSDAFRAHLLNHLADTIRGTVFRQTMFAEFERDIHVMAEEGIPLTADALCSRYAELNNDYHGPAVKADPMIRFEWARIPHFYYGFYVYQYATGLSAAAALSQEVLAGRPERYLAFLRAGDTKDVIDILRDAGVDFATPAPVNALADLFDDTVIRLETLLTK